MKRSDEGESLDPEVERELDAIERALAGLEVDEEMAPVATLVADLREERPEPDAEWAAELDRRAAAGFGGGASSPLSARFAGFRVRSLLLPAGALATLAVVAAVGVGVSGELEGASSDAGSPLSAGARRRPAAAGGDARQLRLGRRRGLGRPELGLHRAATRRLRPVVAAAPRRGRRAGSHRRTSRVQGRDAHRPRHELRHIRRSRAARARSPPASRSGRRTGALR